MKILIMVLMVGLMGCDLSVQNEELNIKEDIPAIHLDDIYIVAGQSNAVSCKWAHFEEMTGSKVIRFAIPAMSISSLIDEYNDDALVGVKPKGVLFVHGETDGKEGTNVNDYNRMTEEYRVMMSVSTGVNLPLYISTVGYWKGEPDLNFDLLRGSVVAHADINPMWHIGYGDVKNFRAWGLLFDGLHFKEEGCDLMMEGFASSI